MAQIVQIELSIKSSTTGSQILINPYITGHIQNMFYDSAAQFTQFTD